jgi:hypothetical protein
VQVCYGRILSEKAVAVKVVICYINYTFGDDAHAQSEDGSEKDGDPGNSAIARRAEDDQNLGRRTRMDDDTVCNGMLAELHKGQDVTNEEFLLRAIKSTADGLDECAQGIPNISSFADGEVSGLSYASEKIKNAILLYNKKCSGEMLVDFGKVG